MYRFHFILFVLPILTVASNAWPQQRNVVVEPAPPKTWAVVIGVERYQAAPRLACAVKDAESFGETLVKLGRIDPAQILTITDKTDNKPDYATLARQIGAWLDKAGERDTLLLFFSGHGVWNAADGRMYLVAADTRLEDLEHTALGIARLREQLGRCRAASKVLILDCCHSGALKSESLDGEQLTKAFGDVSGVVTLASCKGNQVSLEWKEKGLGLFSYWLIRGLSGEADLLADGSIDVDELFRFVSQQVPQSAQEQFGMNQTPVRSIGPEVEGVPVVLVLPRRPQSPPPSSVLVSPLAASSAEAPVVGLPLREDFQTTDVGALPEHWTGDAPVGVRREGTVAWLQASAEGTHRVQSRAFGLVGDFQLELRAMLESRARLEVTLEGREGSPDLTMTFGSPVNNARVWKVSLTGATPQDLQVSGDRANRVRLIRQGAVYRLIVNDQTVIAQRMPEHVRFGRLVFGLSGPNKMSYIESVTKVFDVELAALGSESRIEKGDLGPVPIHLARPPTALGLRCVEVGGNGGVAGLLIIAVEPDSAAAQAGLAYGQTITHVDDQPVTRFQQLVDRFGQAEPRGSMKFQTQDHFNRRRAVEITWSP